MPAEQTDIDPFLVTPYPIRPQNILIFLLFLPISLPFILLGSLGCLLIAPFYRGLSLPLKDKGCQMLSWFFKVGTRLTIRLTDHNLSRKDHSALYVSSHVCMAEVNILMMSLGHIRIMTAEFTKTIPFFNIPVKALDPIYVSRGKKNPNTPSPVTLLKQSIAETKYRHLIFPEGTYTNGKTLIRFKSGAFVLGIPVTPVIFHYPKYVPFWNRKESNILVQFYRLMSQVYTPVRIEILPTYHPSQEEINNPKIYAANVREYMGFHARRPLSDKSLQDSPNYQLDVQAKS